jgi:hypothetical protein
LNSAFNAAWKVQRRKVVNAHKKSAEHKKAVQEEAASSAAFEAALKDAVKKEIQDKCATGQLILGTELGRIIQDHIKKEIAAGRLAKPTNGSVTPTQTPRTTQTGNDTGAAQRRLF